jgi:excisionase family DNA binding protein
MEAKKSVKLKEAAFLLDESVSSVRRLINRRLLRAIRTTRHLHISMAEIERYLRDHTN